MLQDDFQGGDGMMECDICSDDESFETGSSSLGSDNGDISPTVVDFNDHQNFPQNSRKSQDFTTDDGNDEKGNADDNVLILDMKRKHDQQPVLETRFSITGRE